MKTSNKIVSNISFVVSILLLLVKFYAYKVTSSQAILSDAMESIVNVLSALILIIANYYALKPADKNHPYGHGKIEYFSSIFEGGAIATAGILIVFEAINAIVQKSTIVEIEKGLILIVLSGLINGLLGLALVDYAKKTNSHSIESNGKHLISDFITTIGIVIGLFLVKLTGLYWIDSVTAIIVGTLLSKEGIFIFYKSASHLIDSESKEVISELCELIEKHYRPGIIEVHSLKTIRSGNYHHIDLHLVIPEDWTIKKGHEFGEAFEQNILKDYKYDGELHFHLDPCEKSFCKECEVEKCHIRIDPFIKRKPSVVNFKKDI